MSRNKKEMQPFWRPNFVNQSELPDIKVVRTDFVINFIAITLTLCVAFFLLQREYRAYSLGKTIGDMEKQIRVAEADDAEYLKQSEAFRESAMHVVEMEKFFDAPLLPHEFLFGLSQIKPDDLIFTTVSLSESVKKVGGKKQVVYNINITGDVKNLTVLDDFKSVLGETDLLQLEGFTVEVNETLQGRNDKTGIFPYKVAISVVPSKAKAPAGK